MSLPEDLKYYRRPSVFDLMTEDEARNFLFLLLGAALVCDWMGWL